MQADSEHQQDHADLGELRRERLVGDETGRGRPGDDAGDQIADERRQPQALREQAQHQGQHEADAEQGDQRGVMGHRISRDRLRIITPAPARVRRRC